MNKYEVQGIVGEGAYGVVIRCRHKESGEVRAIKKFRESEDDEAVRKTAVREVKILKMLRHSSIVHLHEAFRRKGRLYLVFEFMPMNLLNMLEEQPGGRSLQETRKYLHQLVHAIDWCHQHSVIHRDIKPENLLVDEGRGLLKLCDFGFSRMLPVDGRPAELTDYVATRWYRSPELLLGLTHYGYEVDIWAIGCIMGELLDGAALFPGESDVDQLYVIQTVLGPLTEDHREAFLSCDLYTGVQLPEVEEDAVIGLGAKYERKLGRGEIAAVAVEFMAGVLAIDSHERLTAEQCVDHSFFDAEDKPSQQTRQRQRGRQRLQRAIDSSQTTAQQAGASEQHQHGRGEVSSDNSTRLPPNSRATSVYKNSWRRHAAPKHVDTHSGNYLRKSVAGCGHRERQRSESVPVVGSTGNLEQWTGGSVRRHIHSRDGGDDGPYTQRPPSQGTTSASTWSEHRNWQYKQERRNEQDCHRNSNADNTADADYRFAQGYVDFDYGLSVAGVRDAAAADSLKLPASFALPHSHFHSHSHLQAREVTRAEHDFRAAKGFRNSKDVPMARSSSTHQMGLRDGIAGGTRSKGSFGKVKTSATLPFMMKRQLPALGVAVPQGHRRPM